MGTDKAFLEVGGGWLIAHVLGALDGAAQRLVVGGTDPRLEEAAAAAGAVHVADRWPGEGPLGAVATVLKEARYPIAVALPCDLPDISSGDVAALVQAVGSVSPEESPAVSAFVDQRRHYLPLAIDSRAAAAVERLFESGERAMSSLFESGERAMSSLFDGVIVIDVPAPPSAVADIDRPEDLSR